MNRKATQLITKSLPRLEHHEGAANEISKENNNEKNETPGGTGKGSAFSGEACGDVSFFMFRGPEKKKLSIQLDWVTMDN